MTDTVALAVTGAGFGFLIGFFARGLVGEVGGLRVRRLVGRLRRSAEPISGGAAVRRVTEAFAGDADLGSLHLEVLPVRGGRLELHGWVPTRRAGARAVRLAGETVPGIEVTNRLRVRGEDDHPAVPAEDVERRPA